MAVNPIRNVVIQPNSGTKRWRTVNVVAAVAPKGGKSHTQVPAAQNTLGQHPTYQPTASPVKGLQTVYISTYSGPA
jgi:hypothetical protein